MQSAEMRLYDDAADTLNFARNRCVLVQRQMRAGLVVICHVRSQQVPKVTLAKDNDMVEGLMPNDLTQIAPEGFLLNPPDTRGNTQRIFVPRSALASLNVLAVIGGMQGRRRPVKEEAGQETLFSE